MKESKEVGKWESSKRDTSGEPTERKEIRVKRGDIETSPKDNGRNKDDQTVNLKGVTTTHTLEDRQSNVTIPSRQGNCQMLFDLNELLEEEEDTSQTTLIQNVSPTQTNETHRFQAHTSRMNPTPNPI